MLIFWRYLIESIGCKRFQPVRDVTEYICIYYNRVMATPQNIRYILYSPHLSIPHHLPTLSPTHPLLSHIFSFYFPHPLPSSHLFPLLSLTLSHISIHIPHTFFPSPISPFPYHLLSHRTMSIYPFRPLTYTLPYITPYKPL